ncbi:MAG: hypothetical protein QOG53_2655 [Frankiales bacterium]|jgi:hypothetical protein|nr:hypothetical protein [Frankiales bacterium]
MIRKRNIVTGAAIAGAAVLAAGIAYAAWSSSGTGSGRASSGSAVVVTVSASTGPADLYPGFTAGDVSFTLTNTNPYAVTFTSMTTPGTAVSSDPTACPNVNVTAVAKAGLSLVVEANSTSEPLSITDVVGMATDAPDGCQAKTFDIGLTLTGAQS